MLTTITVYRMRTWHKNTTSERGVLFPQVTQDDTLSVSFGAIRKIGTWRRSMFYLTLPSNSSMNYCPNNTLTHYTTKLPKITDLDGAWKIGLAEIQYPHSWYSVMNNEAWLKVHFGTIHVQSIKSFLDVHYPIWNTLPAGNIACLNPNMDCIKGLMMTWQSFFTFISILWLILLKPMSVDSLHDEIAENNGSGRSMENRIGRETVSSHLA
jgi:hypothetical protein